MPPIGFILRCFVPLALGYVISYFVRSVNAVIAPDLMADLNIGAEQLGLLSSMYFLGFACMQLPLGLLLDRFGPARVQAVLLSVAASGMLLFGLGNDLLTLSLARALIGIGVAGALMSAFTGFVHWFPARQLPLVNGLYMMAGGLGALLATRPVEALLLVSSWQHLFMGISGCTAAVALIIWRLTPAVPRHTPALTWRQLLTGVATIFTHRAFWRIVPLTAATIGSAFALQGLWAGPWLSDVAGLSRGEIANVLALMAIGLTIGSGSLGLVVAAGRRIGLPNERIFLGLTLIYLAVILGLTLQIGPPAALLLWVTLGALTNLLALSYSVLGAEFAVSHAGRVNTAINVVVVGTSFLLQYWVGWIIDWWPRGADGSYPPAAHAAGTGSVLLIIIACLLRFALARR